MKILMVCLGNICRSPLAEGIMWEKIRSHNLPWEVDSAGTSNYHLDEPPDERSVEVAKKYGLDITQQRGRQFAPYDFELFDKIFVMDLANYDDVVRLAMSDEERDKVDLILNSLYPGQNKEVPDPYWDDDGFEQVYRMLDAACEEIVRKEKQVARHKS